MSTVEKDFDRLALLDSSGWTHNNHYHEFLLRHVPPDCRDALDIGCGTGALSRRLAERASQVVAIDLSSEMIRIARDRDRSSNIDFQVADFMTWDIPTAGFDCVTSIATLHHLPLRAAFLKMKTALRPGGVLLVIDLFEPERSLLKMRGLADAFLNLIAMGVSGSLRLLHNGRIKPPREVRAAWEAHGKTDRYPTMNEVRALCDELFPGAKVRRHLLWRYSIVWRKPPS